MLKTLIAVSITAGCLHAASITTSVTCDSIVDHITAAASNNCSVGTTGFAQASSVAAFSLNNNSLAVNISQNVYTNESASLPPGVYAVADASATANIDLTLSSQGPLRPGILQISFPTVTWNGTPTTVSTSVNFSVGSFSDSCSEQGVGDNSTACIDLASIFSPADPYSMQPIELGAALSFAFSQATTASLAWIDGESIGTAMTNAQFQFFEADGVTPVTITAVPEPTGISFETGALLTALLAFRFRFKTSRGTNLARCVSRTED